MDNVIRTLSVKLTQEEFDQRAADLANVNKEIESLTSKKKSAASEFSSKIDDAKSRLSRLVSVVAKRAELREISCLQRINKELRIVEIVRTDTSEIVETRAVTSR